MKILLIGHIGKGNFGDDFMTKALIEYIFELNIKNQINCLSKTKILEHKNIKYSRENIKNIFMNIKSSDIVLVNGGNFFHDINKNIRFRFSPFIKFFVISLISRLQNKKVIYSGQGFGPLKTKWSKYFFKIIFSMSEYVSVRDEYSYKLFKKIMNVKHHDKIHLTADSTFYNHPINNIIKKENKDPLSLGINILPYFEMYRNNKKNDIKLMKSLDSYLCDLVEKNIIKNKIFFFAFNKKKSESEINSFKYLKKNSLLEFELIVFNSVEQFTNDFNKKIDFFIGMRLHGIILASILNKPQMNISYHPKCNKLGTYIGLNSKQFIDINKPNFSEIEVYANKLEYYSNSSKIELDKLKNLFKKNSIPKYLFS